METFRAAILDTETTGAGSRDQIIELAVLVHDYSLESGEVVAETARLESFHEPTVPIHPMAQAVHGLSMADVRGHRMRESDVVQVLRGCHAVIAHNASFDKGMLGSHFAWTRQLPWRCSCWGIRWRNLGFQNAKLQTLLAAHRINPGRAHRAMDDVEGLFRLLQHEHTADGRRYIWHAVRAAEFAEQGVGAGFDPWAS